MEKSNRRYDMGLMKRTYFYDLLRKFIHPLHFGIKGSEGTEFSVVRIPTIHGKTAEAIRSKDVDRTSIALERLMSLSCEEPKEAFPSDPNFKDIEKFWKRLKSIPELKFFKEVCQNPKFDIKDFPPLPVFGEKTVLVHKSKAQEIQTQVCSSFAQFWLTDFQSLKEFDDFLDFDVEDCQLSEFNQRIKFQEVVLPELRNVPRVGDVVTMLPLDPQGDVCIRRKQMLDLPCRGFQSPADGGLPQLPEVFQKLQLTSLIELNYRSRILNGQEDDENAIQAFSEPVQEHPFAGKFPNQFRYPGQHPFNFQ
jgi:hypothetical protein